MSDIFDDNFGNPHRRLSFGIGTDVVGQARDETILPGATIKDLVPFDLPIESRIKRPMKCGIRRSNAS